MYLRVNGSSYITKCNCLTTSNCLSGVTNLGKLNNSDLNLQHELSGGYLDNLFNYRKIESKEFR